ncbi:TetR/AcrR family transcriptional regulator [Sphingomonas sp.]|uniref:TetR/AcrR family transcriptional regulator n=1 Tax=Sphingomonas sp. TaxID=28214 RepID=UPI003D6D4B8B
MNDSLKYRFDAAMTLRARAPNPVEVQFFEAESLNKSPQANGVSQKKTRTKPTLMPKQARAIQTREHLLDVAGSLLAEVGLEDISTNMICARAGMSPPALYRYFADKHAVLEALGMRLMERQNELLIGWLESSLTSGLDGMFEKVEVVLRETAELTAAEPGGVWIERALHASPRLSHIRIESHRFVTDALLEVFSTMLPDVPRDVLWRRIRFLIELGYAAHEMMGEEERIAPETVYAETARMMRFVLLGDDGPPKEL